MTVLKYLVDNLIVFSIEASFYLTGCVGIVFAHGIWLDGGSAG